MAPTSTPFSARARANRTQQVQTIQSSARAPVAATSRVATIHSLGAKRAAAAQIARIRFSDAAPAERPRAVFKILSLDSKPDCPTRPETTTLLLAHMPGAETGLPFLMHFSDTGPDITPTTDVVT